MKKIFLVLFISLIFLSLFAITNPVLSTDPNSDSGGLVPCGNGDPTLPSGEPNPNYDKCEIDDFFEMFARIYSFIVKYIATTLAVIMIITGAVFLMISAGNPSLAGTGKNMIKFAIIGLVLIFGSWLIIDAILNILGYSQNWFSL